MSSCAYCLAAKLHEIAFKKRIRDEMMVKTKDLKIAVNRKVKLSQEALNTFSKRMRNNRTSGVVVEIMSNGVIKVKWDKLKSIDQIHKDLIEVIA